MVRGDSHAHCDHSPVCRHKQAVCLQTFIILQQQVRTIAVGEQEREARKLLRNGARSMEWSGNAAGYDTATEQLGQ